MDPTSPATIDANLLVNLVFGLIGVIGTIFAVVQWRSAKQTDRAYKYLLQLAEKNIEKDISEEELTKKREDIKEATNQINSLQEQIRREIPMEARKAVLRDRLYAEVEHLSHAYTSVVELKKQLNEIPATDIPPDLMKKIESEISPEYVINEQKSNLKTYLTILTTGTAVLSALIQSPIERFITIPLLILAIPILVQLLRLSIPRQYDQRQKMIAQMKYIIPLLGGIFFSGFSLLLILLNFGSYYYYPEYTLWGMLFLGIALGLFGVSLMMYRWFKRVYIPTNTKRKDKPNGAI